MTKKTKKTLINLTGWLVAVALLLVLVGFSSSQQKTLECTGVDILIDRSSGNYFVLEDDVKATLKNLGYQLPGDQKLKMIDIKELEDFLRDNPYVSNADVYSTINGKLRIEIQQRNPLIRVYNKDGESFYLDQEGKIMPLSFSYTARVLVANGNIGVDYMTLYKMVKNEKWNIDKFRERLLKSMEKKGNLPSQALDSLKVIDQYLDILNLANYIDQHEFWKAQVTQIYLNENGDYELIPRVGNHNIVLGEPLELEEKFEKLWIFYKEGLPKTGWNEYSTVNLKFKNQIVCTKI